MQLARHLAVYTSPLYLTRLQLVVYDHLGPAPVYIRALISAKDLSRFYPKLKSGFASHIPPLSRQAWPLIPS